MPSKQKICWPKRSHGASFIEFDAECTSLKVIVVYSYIILLHIYIAVYPYAKVDDTSIIMYSLISCQPYYY